MEYNFLVCLLVEMNENYWNKIFVRLLWYILVFSIARYRNLESKNWWLELNLCVERYELIVGAIS